MRRDAHPTAPGDRRRGVGRGVLTVANVAVLIGGWIADMNKTHMFNPRWTPHAKFHDGMTISLGTLAGAAGLYCLYRRPLQAGGNEAAAALLPAAIFASQASAFLYPGAKGLDAEFPDLLPRIAGRPMNELPISLVGLGAALAGYLLTRAGRR